MQHKRPNQRRVRWSDQSGPTATYTPSNEPEITDDEGPVTTASYRSGRNTLNIAPFGKANTGYNPSRQYGLDAVQPVDRSDPYTPGPRPVDLYNTRTQFTASPSPNPDVRYLRSDGLPRLNYAFDNSGLAGPSPFELHPGTEYRGADLPRSNVFNNDMWQRPVDQHNQQVRQMSGLGTINTSSPNRPMSRWAEPIKQRVAEKRPRRFDDETESNVEKKPRKGFLKGLTETWLPKWLSDAVLGEKDQPPAPLAAPLVSRKNLWIGGGTNEPSSSAPFVGDLSTLRRTGAEYGTPRQAESRPSLHRIGGLDYYYNEPPMEQRNDDELSKQIAVARANRRDAEPYKPRVLKIVPTTRSRLLAMIKLVKKHLNNIDGQWCVSSAGPSKARVFGEFADLVGRGSVSNVYRVYRNGRTFIVKEAILRQDEYEALRDNDELPIETYISGALNELIRTGVSPHFPTAGPVRFCSRCRVETVKGASLTDIDTVLSNNCATSVHENFEGDLETLFRDLNAGGKKISNQLLGNLLFQVLHGLASAQQVLGMYHGDIKARNILFKLIPEGGYWEYRIFGTSYYLPNMGFLLALGDFGTNSRLYHPKWSRDGDLGVRGIRISEDGRSVQQYSSQFTVVSNYEAQTVSLALNTNVPNPYLPRFFSGFDIVPSVDVDLEDWQRFPVRLGVRDNYDAINMFIAGPFSTKYGFHKGANLEMGSLYSELSATMALTPAGDVSSQEAVHPPYMYSAAALIHRFFSTRLTQRPTGKRAGSLYEVFELTRY
jgi:hypothetical protein